MRVGSLFTGVGGFDLAAEWQGWSVAWQSEIDPYCTELLKEQFPGVPNLGDITTINWSGVERPDIITGGFPCQDISYAGKGAGLAGARSGLWYEYARAIRSVGPRYVVVENVAALLTRGIGDVLGTLADLGYDAEWAVYGAADVGAPHERLRSWILAWRREDVCDPSGGRCGGESRRGDGPESADGRSDVSDCQRERLEGIEQGRPAPGATHGPRDGRDPAERAAQSDLGRVVDGLSDRLDRRPLSWEVEPQIPRVERGVVNRVHRIRGLGNAIVPECVLPIYHRIKELERGMK